MNQKRDYGIDLLRIVATYMIIILHILGVGGIIYTIDNSSRVYVMSWGLEFFAYCAVNCYALISGYVGLKSKFRFFNILNLWCQVVVTSGIITLIGWFLGVNIGLRNMLEVFVPVIAKTYWYFTAYVGLFLLTPFLNRLIETLDKKTAKYLLLTLFVLFSVLPIFGDSDMFYVNYGYSAAWLIILYLAGAIIKKFFADTNISRKFWLVMYVAAVLITLISKLGIEYLLTKSPNFMYDSNFLMNYNSPTMVLAAVSLLYVFANLKVKKMEKIIRLLAPFTFGIYIIHTHPIVWDYILANRFEGFVNYGPIALVLLVLGTAIFILIICVVLEYIRQKYLLCLKFRTYAKK